MTAPMNPSKLSVAEHLAARIAAVDARPLPAGVRRKCEDLTLDVIGLLMDSAMTVTKTEHIRDAVQGD